METAYFPSRVAVQTSTTARNTGVTLRRVNLADAFLSLIGKEVA